MLLAKLLSQNTLVQPEVALTRATQFLLGLPRAAHALDELVGRRSGLTPEPGGYWLTEVWGPEGGRTDLEYRWGPDEKVQVIVEAKVGHSLGGDQVDAYRGRMGEEGLLVVLVPATRQREGWQVVEQLRRTYKQASDAVRVDLWTWDEVAGAFESALPRQPDVIQLRGLVKAAGALDLSPFGAGELVTSDRSRFDDLWSVLDRASFLGFPAQRNGYFEKYRFYPLGDYDAYFSVGIGRVHRSDQEPWCWVHFARDAHLGLLMQETVKTHWSEAMESGDSVDIPLRLEPGLSGYELTESLRTQLEGITVVVREDLRAYFAVNDRTAAQAEPSILAPLHGMPAFTSGELLDSDRSRRQDIQIVVDQACRHILAGGSLRWYGRDAGFSRRNWIPVDGYQTYVSIGIERLDDSESTRPWAWLFVHETAPHAEVVFRALDEAFPGHVENIPRGRGIPLSMTEGQNGLEAFESVVAQIESAKTAIRGCLQSRT